MPSQSVKRPGAALPSLASVHPLPNSTEGREPLLTPRQASNFLQVPESTLAVWRSTGRVQLPFVKVGGHVRYRREDIERYLAGGIPAKPPAEPSRVRNTPKPVPKTPYPHSQEIRERIEAWRAERGELVCDNCGDRVEPIDARILTAAEAPRITLSGRATGEYYCLCAECNNLGCPLDPA